MSAHILWVPWPSCQEAPTAIQELILGPFALPFTGRDNNGRISRSSDGHPQHFPTGHGRHRRCGARLRQRQAGTRADGGRFRLVNEVLVWHARGEELAIFPTLEPVAPSVAEGYEGDHRGLDAGFDALSAGVSANDALATAPATAAFRSISTFTSERKMPTCTGLSESACPRPTRAKLSVSCQAPCHRTGSPR